MVPELRAKTARAMLLAVLLLWGAASARPTEAGTIASRQQQEPVPSSTPTITQESPEASPTFQLTPSSTNATATVDAGTAIPSATPASLTATPSPLISPEGSATPSPSASSTVPATVTSTLTPNPAQTATPSGVPAGTVLINEVAWAGTGASAHDEWIELYNTSDQAVPLDGWFMTDGGDISINLSGVIGPRAFFLLERTDDSTISNLTADLIYTGAMRNSGEALQLFSPEGALIDTANAAGGAWPAGEAASRASMERLGPQDLPGNWNTFHGSSSALDADGNPVAGSPGQTNSGLSATPTASPTSDSSPTPTPAPAPVGSVLINEVAWAGTRASANDEWIELYNPGTQAIDLTNWALTDGGDINVQLEGQLLPQQYFLLERTDDDSVSDIQADLVYSGSLRNDGEALRLLDSYGNEIDSANSNGGGWPAGSADSRYSMERWGGAAQPDRWATFTGYGSRGHDAEGNAIGGTPGGSNSILVPTPTPTWIPGSVIINEVLIRPHYDWEGTGGVTTADEFIELYNRGPGDVWLRGWLLDDVSGSGSKPFALPGVTISEHGYAVFFRSLTHIALNDSGDSVRLLDPSGNMIDKLHYERVRAYNLSYGRLPNGSNELSYGLWPTPGEANLLFVEPGQIEGPSWQAQPAFACPQGGSPTSLPARLARLPWQTRWIQQLGLVRCR